MFAADDTSLGRRAESEERGKGWGRGEEGEYGGGEVLRRRSRQIDEVDDVAIPNAYHCSGAWKEMSVLSVTSGYAVALLG